MLVDLTKKFPDRDLDVIFDYINKNYSSKPIKYTSYVSKQGLIYSGVPESVLEEVIRDKLILAFVIPPKEVIIHPINFKSTLQRAMQEYLKFQGFK